MAKKKKRTPKYEINRELVLSTAHIPMKDAKMFDSTPVNAELNRELWWMEHIAFGYRIYIGDDIEAEVVTCGASAALLGLVQLARKLRCKWLVLDSDGPVHAELAEFKW